MYTQAEKSKENKSRTLINSVTQKRSKSNLRVGFADNRKPLIVQRISANKSVIQLACVSTYCGKVSQNIIDEVKRIVGAAETAGGRRSEDHFLLDKVERKKGEVPKELKPGSQATWGVGAIELEDSEPYMVTIGKGDWANAMGTSDHLGGRPSTLHAEMGIVAERPGVVAISATQDCCLFCYGYLASRNYEHPALRTNVWPNTGWTHPQNGFRLLTGASVTGNVISVTFRGETRQFQVFMT